MKGFLEVHDRLLFASFAIGAVFLWSHVGLSIHLLCGHCRDHAGGQDYCRSVSDHNCQDCCSDKAETHNPEVSAGHCLLRKPAAACPVCMAFLNRLHEVTKANACCSLVCLVPGETCAVEVSVAAPRRPFPRHSPPRAPPFWNS